MAKAWTLSVQNKVIKLMEKGNTFEQAIARVEMILRVKLPENIVARCREEVNFNAREITRGN